MRVKILSILLSHILQCCRTRSKEYISAKISVKVGYINTIKILKKITINKAHADTER